MLPTRIAFVDVETTGGRAERDRVIEIGIIRMEDNQITKTYETLINPNRFLPPEIEILTGIQAHQLESAPYFKDIAEEISEILTDCVFVAHNVRFDYSFLLREFERIKQPFSMKHFCTVKLSRALFPQHLRHNLDAIKERFQLDCENRHRAFQDAHLLYQFYQKLLTDFPLETVTTTVTTLLKAPSLPTNLTADQVKILPRRPGVYIFYDKNHTPLYVGKSKNIHDRVLSHFSSDLRSPKEMNISQQLTDIETITTPGELGALFLESHLVKKLLPIYNRRLRIKQELIALTRTTDQYGYETVQISPITTIDPNALDTFLGFFNSRKQAKEYLTNLAKDHQLCGKLLGLEKTSTSCFANRLGTCKGACVQKEKPLFYNLRFTTAFTLSKIRPWPFPGKIAITEQWELTGEKEYLVFDKWCYLGSICIDSEGVETFTKREKVFDLDIYSILLQYLRSRHGDTKIKILGEKTMDFESQLQLFEESHVQNHE